MNTPKSILCVEDEIIIRVLVKRLLSDYDVVICHSGEMAMEELSKRKFDAILIDINLGSGINGIELCKSIRKEKGYERTPIGAVTAQWINTKEELFREGFSHYMPKPFDREQIITFVEKMLSRSV